MKNRVFIVGGGPSLLDISLSRLIDEHTIVTNVAIFDVPHPNFFITMDYSFLFKIRGRIPEFTNSQATKMFIAGLHNQNLVERRGRFFDTKNDLSYDLSLFDMTIKAYSEIGCGYKWNDFRSGSNSGCCALQLAILLGYTDIYLLGMDLTATKIKTHYHGYYAKDRNFHDKLQQYDEAFRHLIQGSDVAITSCSPTSSLNDILEFVPLEDVL